MVEYIHKIPNLRESLVMKVSLREYLIEKEMMKHEDLKTFAGPFSLHFASLPMHKKYMMCSTKKYYNPLIL